MILMVLEEVTTAVGSSNIALTKYWGKRNEKLILPTNSSLSMTLDEGMHTRTSVLFSDRIGSDMFYLNGVKQDFNDKDVLERFVIIDELRKVAGTKARAFVASHNNFPTAAGFASSAAGIATLVYAATKALDLSITTKEMSIIARQGSGSSCRSLLGGFVKWRKGEMPDGLDSYAEQIADEKHWPEVIDIVAIIAESKKKVSSRSGMKQTVETSMLYRNRPQIAEQMTDRLAEAIEERDFDTLADITMRESNSLHAVMMDTYPPIIYLNDVSRAVIGAVNELNESEGRKICAYTFDAGPNAQIITLERHKDRVLKMLSSLGGITKTVVAEQGSGPRVVGSEYSLIDSAEMKPMAYK